MYKYCFVIAVSMVALNACEFVSGVTINDPEMLMLFRTAENLYSQDKGVREEIEELYIEYLCLVANHGTISKRPLNDARYRATLESRIAEKKRDKAE